MAWLVGALAVIGIVYQFGWQHGRDGKELDVFSVAQAKTAAEGARKTYYPNTEELGPNEMRVISLGTGMPNQRKSQASACWLVELGNGDKFLFDLGTGSVANLSVLEIPYDLVNKAFIGHLHSDHVGTLPLGTSAVGWEIASDRRASGDRTVRPTIRTGEPSTSWTTKSSPSPGI